MNDLDKIIELINSMGGNAKEAFYVWLVVQVLSPAVNGLCVVFSIGTLLSILYALGKRIHAIIDIEQRIVMAVYEAGRKCGKVESDRLPFYDSTKRQMLEFLKNLDRENNG